MAFQILNKHNKAINLKDLDNDACELWNVPLNTSYYAKPYPKSHFPNNIEGSRQYFTQLSWFDSIGKTIHTNHCNTWDDIIHHLKQQCLPFLNKNISFEQLMEKELQLINHWKNKNYKPLYLKE